MILLAKLFEDFPFDYWGELPERVIQGVSADTRAIQPGYLFIAIQGYTVDGHSFIPQAISKGAAAVVGTERLAGLPVPYIRVENSRQALAYLVAAFFDNPARKLTMIGVTGTDGKTTTVNLIFHILQAAGIKVGMISTVNAVIGEKVLETGFHVTTPEAPDIQRYLAMMVAAGLTHCVLETTSHGWVQHRVDACEFDVGVLTNITHEHLDEHGTFEDYCAAKARLFQNLEITKPKDGKVLRIGIMNQDDDSFAYIQNILKSLPSVQGLAYSSRRPSDVEAREIRSEGDKVIFTVKSGTLEFDVVSYLPSDYNISNCLAAIAATVGGLKIDYHDAQKAIENFPGIPGRMENIDLGQSFTAIVDFAHTPNALLRSLESLRDKHPKRIIAVFGSAGLRDREKRRKMAEIAARRSDISIITAEDPRTEPLESILSEMTKAAVDHGAVVDQSLFVLPDRRQAIRKAVSLANEGEVVILCGKGHEQSMCFGTVEYPWDDRTALRAAIAERLGIEGPAMPWLPNGD